jgi:DNA-binding NtrC family response regulator
MAFQNLLFVDDNPAMLELGVDYFKALTPNIDTATDYASAMEKLRASEYGLTILDGLEGKCFDIYKNLGEEGIFYGEFVILSGDVELQIKAKELRIPFYAKPNGLSQIVKDYRDKFLS